MTNEIKRIISSALSQRQKVSHLYFFTHTRTQSKLKHTIRLLVGFLLVFCCCCWEELIQHLLFQVRFYLIMCICVHHCASSQKSCLFLLSTAKFLRLGTLQSVSILFLLCLCLSLFLFPMSSLSFSSSWSTVQIHRNDIAHFSLFVVAVVVVAIEKRSISMLVYGLDLPHCSKWLGHS